MTGDKKAMEIIQDNLKELDEFRKGPSSEKIILGKKKMEL